MYSMEYRCTRVDTVRTTINIVYVSVSIEKVQLTSNSPEWTQLPMVAVATAPVVSALKRETRYARVTHIESTINDASCFQWTRRLSVSISRKLRRGKSTMNGVMGAVV